MVLEPALVRFYRSRNTVPSSFGVLRCDDTGWGAVFSPVVAELLPSLDLPVSDGLRLRVRRRFFFGASPSPVPAGVVLGSAGGGVAAGLLTGVSGCTVG